MQEMVAFVLYRNCIVLQKLNNSINCANGTCMLLVLNSILGRACMCLLTLRAKCITLIVLIGVKFPDYTLIVDDVYYC